jgi:hypothetical protein
MINQTQELLASVDELKKQRVEPSEENLREPGAGNRRRLSRRLSPHGGRLNLDVRWPTRPVGSEGSGSGRLRPPSR